MPQSNLIYNADIARKMEFLGDDRMNCGCEIVNNGNGTGTGLPVEVGYPWIPVPPVPPPMPWPPIPPQPYPPYPVPVPPIDPDDEPKKGSVEAQICKLSKKASAITKMIEKRRLKRRRKMLLLRSEKFLITSETLTLKFRAGMMVVMQQQLREFLTLNLQLLRQRLLNLQLKLVMKQQATQTVR